MKLKSIVKLVVVAALAGSAAAACGDGRKQQASVALEAARLDLAKARKSGASEFAPTSFVAAQEVLASAEKAFTLKDFPEAEALAKRAGEAALFAESKARGGAAAPASARKAAAPAKGVRRKK